MISISLGLRILKLKFHCPYCIDRLPRRPILLPSTKRLGKAKQNKQAKALFGRLEPLWLKDEMVYAFFFFLPDYNPLRLDDLVEGVDHIVGIFYFGESAQLSIIPVAPRD